MSNSSLLAIVENVIDSEDDNPFRNASLPELLSTFLESQNKIGIRQFAERAKMSRQRLQHLLTGAPVKEEELDAIQNVFITISARIDKAKLRRPKSQLRTSAKTRT